MARTVGAVCDRAYSSLNTASPFYVAEADAQGSQSGRRKAIEKEDRETVVPAAGLPDK